MEQLFYRFVSLFAFCIVAVSLSYVMGGPILAAENYGPSPIQPPLNLTQPLYRTPVIFSQAFPGAAQQNAPPPPVMQPFAGNPMMGQQYAVIPAQNPAGQAQGYSNNINPPDEKSFIIKAPRKMGTRAKSPYDPRHSCKKYLKQAAEKTGVLPEILWAVAKTESNYEGGPWPWTINVAGKGYYFPTQEKARKFLKSLSPSRKYRVDVGCMQVNWGYHGEGFPYLSKMLNPRVNTLYGARFLKKLYQETGNWARAIAAYHSRNQRLGNPYAAFVAHQVKKYPK